ncbi:hypothetical protein DXG01_001663 [Tephrocybe rancida]|nr:hypothetical protein DXG01_001663 [Tephrocybe rancida]
MALTHGFFVIMGGFHVCESHGPSCALDPEDIGPYLENHDIEVSEKDIQDKSKGDVLSKCLVLLQVTWFVLQVLARVVQHLAITELEIATLAFAVLNFMTYFCWWNKPLDVNCPIRVTAFHPTQRSDDDTVTTTLAPSIIVFETFENTLTLDDLEKHTFSAPAGSPYPDSFPGMTHDENTEVTSHRFNFDDAFPHQTISDIPFPDKAILAAERTSFKPGHNYGYDSNGEETHFVPVLRLKRWSTFVKSALTQIADFVYQGWPLCSYILALTARTLNSAIDLTSSEFAKLAVRGHSRARQGEFNFGTLNQTENMLADSLACGVAVIFGAIHCLAWHFDFPTNPEAFLWRVSSIIITCLPTYALILPRFRLVILSTSKNTLRHLHERSRTSIWLRLWLLFKLYIFSGRVAQVVYITARLLLLVQMFVLLRERDKGVYTFKNTEASLLIDVTEGFSPPEQAQNTTYLDCDSNYDSDPLTDSKYGLLKGISTHRRLTTLRIYMQYMPFRDPYASHGRTLIMKVLTKSHFPALTSFELVIDSDIQPRPLRLIDLQISDRFPYLVVLALSPVLFGLEEYLKILSTCTALKELAIHFTSRGKDRPRNSHPVVVLNALRIGHDKNDESTGPPMFLPPLTRFTVVFDEPQAEKRRSAITNALRDLIADWAQEKWRIEVLDEVALHTGSCSTLGYELYADLRRFVAKARAKLNPWIRASNVDDRGFEEGGIHLMNTNGFFLKAKYIFNNKLHMQWNTRDM